MDCSGRTTVKSKIASELSTIYAWTIDFFKIQKGDAFKVYYENKYIDSICTEKYIGIGRILAAEFTHNGEQFYSFYYKEEGADYGEYYDEQGNACCETDSLMFVDITWSGLSVCR